MSTTSDELSQTTEAVSGATNGARQAAREVAGTVATAASEAAARLPDAAQTTRDAVEEANKVIRGGSDEVLSAGTTLSVGLALGLLLGGANRILVILALIPAAAMGFALLDRSKAGRTLKGR